MYTVQTTFDSADYTAYVIASGILRGINRSDRKIVITDPETGEIVFQYGDRAIQWADIDFVNQALAIG